MKDPKEVGIDQDDAGSQGADPSVYGRIEPSGGEQVAGGPMSKPNVFVFLIDDLGWADMGYSSTDLAALTPNFDALASGGVKVSVSTSRYPYR